MPEANPLAGLQLDELHNMETEFTNFGEFIGKLRGFMRRAAMPAVGEASSATLPTSSASSVPGARSFKSAASDAPPSAGAHAAAAARGSQADAVVESPISAGEFAPQQRARDSVMTQDASSVLRRMVFMAGYVTTAQWGDSVTAMAADVGRV